jgi:hypothetical protein
MNDESNQAVQVALSAQQIQAGVRDLAERIREWWRKNGLGHTSELSLTEGGHVLAKFSCSGSSLMDMLEDEDLSEQDYENRLLARFRAQGFVSQAVPGEGVLVLACDESSAALKRLLKETFPSSLVRGQDTRVLGHFGGKFVLLTVQVLIRDLSEVLALPLPPKTS